MYIYLKIYNTKTSFKIWFRLPYQTVTFSVKKYEYIYVYLFIFFTKFLPCFTKEKNTYILFNTSVYYRCDPDATFPRVAPTRPPTQHPPLIIFMDFLLRIIFIDRIFPWRVEGAFLTFEPGSCPNNHERVPTIPSPIIWGICSPSPPPLHSFHSTFYGI